MRFEINWQENRDMESTHELHEMEGKHHGQSMDDMPDMSHQHDMKNMHKSHYRRLLGMAVLSFIAMYILMYAMVDVLANVLPNFNQFYMAGLMTAPMVVIELLLMGSMYPNKRLNAGIIAVSLALGLAFFFLIRQQGAIGDRQFLKSMIPHHAGAILMCEQASIEDPEIADLCEGIIASQRSEIDQMKGMLVRLDELEDD